MTTTDDKGWDPYLAGALGKEQKKKKVQLEVTAEKAEKDLVEHLEKAATLTVATFQNINISFENC